MTFKKVSLEGEQVKLEPLSEQHKSGLIEAISDGELWKLFVTLVPHPEQIDNFFDRAHAEFQSSEGIAFAIIDKSSGRVAGSTRLMRASLIHKRIEIGFTFLGKSWQKSRINTEAKLLLLQYCFETLDMNRVEFLTDYLNKNSHRAILRLGAKEEGILRNHMIMPDGRMRDSVLLSIVKYEWPGVKQNLHYKLGIPPQTKTHQPKGAL